MPGGLVAIHDSIGGGLAGAWARFGLFEATVGTAGGVVLLALDGFAARHLAEFWLSARPRLDPPPSRRSERKTRSTSCS